jgi:hypothetical protein
MKKMMIIFILIFLFFSFKMVAQNDIRIGYKSIPETIKMQVKPSQVKSIYHLEEGGYLIEIKIEPDTIYRKDGTMKRINYYNNKSQDIYYSEAGQIINISKIYSTGMNPIATTIGVGIVIYFILILSGQP